jgi:hypothetical protein
MNDRYLMAVIRIPIQINTDGELKLMNEYSKINIEKMEGDLTKTGDTVFGKVVEYLERENIDVLVEEEPVVQEEPLPVVQEEPLPVVQEEPLPVVQEEPLTKLKEEPISKSQVYKFPCIKKSKKPINATFRERVRSQNFTKKVYSS